MSTTLLSRLERRVALALAQLAALQRTVSAREQELCRFVEDYTAQVGLMQRRTEANSATSSLTRTLDIEAQARRLYRTIARRAHPDAGGEAAVFRAASEAYARRDLGALYRLDYTLEAPRNEDARARFLEGLYARVMSAIGALATRLRMLSAHPAARLMLLMEQARSRGQDLMEDLREELSAGTLAQ